MKLSMNKQSVREVDCADILDQFCDPSNRMQKIKKKKYYDMDEDLITKLVNKIVNFKNKSETIIDLLFSVFQ